MSRQLSCQFCGALWHDEQIDHTENCIRHPNNKAPAFNDPLEEIAWLTTQWEIKAAELYLAETSLKEEYQLNAYVTELETAITEKNATCDALQKRIVELERTCDDFHVVSQRHLQAIRVATIITTALAEKIGRLDGTLNKSS